MQKSVRATMSTGHVAPFIEAVTQVRRTVVTAMERDRDAASSWHVFFVTPDVEDVVDAIDQAGFVFAAGTSDGAEEERWFIVRLQPWADLPADDPTGEEEDLRFRQHLADEEEASR